MEQYDMTVSHRDTAALRSALERWLRDRVPDASIASVSRPEGSGMSSDTVLLDATWDGQDHALVVRVAPDSADVPVFRHYDLELQFRVMRLVGERSDAPVPECLWYESDPGVLGERFFVMRRVDGRVPKDNLPYTFEGWLVDAGVRDRMALQDDTVWSLAGIHGVDVRDLDQRDLGHEPGGPCALRQRVSHWRGYYDWLRGDATIPVIEDTFAWLDANWPADDGGPSVLTWGDARIGNVIYDGFRPAAILDWEMACLAPRGVDLGWMAYMHLFFQDVAEQLGLPGLPGFLAIDDLAEAYEARTGFTLADRQFWLVFAALRYGLVMARIEQRQLAFGEIEPDDDPDSGVMHRDWLRAAIAS